MIMLADNGDCEMNDKVENAYHAGMDGIVVLNTRGHDTDSGIVYGRIMNVILDDINTAITLMKEMNVEGWNGDDSDNISYPSPEEMRIIYVKIEWGLPHPNNKLTKKE